MQQLLLLLLLSRFSCVQLCATRQTAAHQAPRPWDSPGKNTGVGCHFLLQCMKVKVKLLSRARLLATPWTAAHQAPPSMGFSRQEYWSGVPLPSPMQQLLKTKYPRAHAPQPEKPPQREARAPQLESSLHCPQLEKAHTWQQRPRAAKNTYILKKRNKEKNRVILENDKMASK